MGFGRARIVQGAILPGTANDGRGPNLSELIPSEVPSDSPLTEETDIFSFGMIVIEVGRINLSNTNKLIRSSRLSLVNPRSVKWN